MSTRIEAIRAHWFDGTVRDAKAEDDIASLLAEIDRRDALIRATYSEWMRVHDEVRAAGGITAATVYTLLGRHASGEMSTGAVAERLREMAATAAGRTPPGSTQELALRQRVRRLELLVRFMREPVSLLDEDQMMSMATVERMEALADRVLAGTETAEDVAVLEGAR